MILVWPRSIDPAAILTVHVSIGKLAAIYWAMHMTIGTLAAIY